MKRKQFLHSFLPLAASVDLLKNTPQIASSVSPKIPPFLKPGDTIGITTPAGFMTDVELLPAITRIKEWGFNVKLGACVNKKDFSFGGTDVERAADFQKMIDDPAIKAILFARGGYGSVRIIEKIDFAKFIQSPKWIIGFSDATVFHCHVQQNFGVAGIHSKMCNSFPEDWNAAEPEQRDSIESIRKCLIGERMTYAVPPSAHNRYGSTKSILIGGNLKVLESIAGSKSSPDTNGKILFLEDTGEYLYSIDRMFRNLLRSGKLEKLSGLIIGGFKIKPDDPGEEFGRTLEQIVLECVRDFDYPVCFNFPVGHQKHNVALRVGVVHELRVGPSGVEVWSD